MITYVAIGLLGLLSLSIPVGIVLFLLGIGIDQFFSSFPLLKGLGNMVWSSSNSATLVAVPFFVLLGETGAQWRGRANVFGLGQMGELAAGRLGARECGHGDDVFCHLRVLCCHSRDRGDGGDAAGRAVGV